MSTEIARREEFDDAKIALIKRTIATNATNDELALFVQVCQRTGLDPFARQIYCIHRGGKMGIQTSIDGFRLIAERNGHYAGQLGPFWCGRDGVWVDVWLESEPPAASKVGVLRSDFKEPAWAVANHSFYAQGGPMWQKGAPHMLAKCAEALALRKAFPQELSGLYTGDEMDQAQPEYAPPKESAAPSPKGVTTAAQRETAPTSTSASSTPSPAKPKGSGAADIIHDGVYITEGQLKVLHITRREVGGQYCTDGGKDEDDARSLWRSKVLAVYRDKDGSRIQSSKQLSKAQANHLIDRLTKYAAKTKETLAARDAETNVTDIIPIKRQPNGMTAATMSITGALKTKDMDAQELCAIFGVDDVTEISNEDADKALALVFAWNTPKFGQLLAEIGGVPQ